MAAGQDAPFTPSRMRVPKPQVIKDPAWLAQIRQMACVNHGTGHCTSERWNGRPSEASHLAGKSRDDLVVPMCSTCHRTGPKAWHKGKQTYCRHFGVTEEWLIALAAHLYAEGHR